AAMRRKTRAHGRPLVAGAIRRIDVCWKTFARHAVEGAMRAIGWACFGAAFFLGCGQEQAPAGNGGSGGTGARALTIHTSGNGSGEVRSSNPSFACKAQCTQSIAASAKVQLVALPAAGSTFAGWQGACAGTGDCTVTMDADRDVTASFSTSSPGAAHISVVFVGKGSGRVTSSPGALDCTATCSMTAPPGSSVSFSAVPDASSSFVGWGGACSGPGGCSVTANGDQTVWANFEVKGPPASCAGIAAPDALPMQQYVHGPERTHYSCLAGLGDANGTLAFPRMFNDANAHGSMFEFVTTGGVLLRDQYDSSESP